MRGRQVFLDSLVAHGVEHIFGNPGTTESPLLDSLTEYPQLEYIVALQESIAMCAASYYAQATAKTGIVNLHVAPGLGNALGMLHGALRSNAPVIVTAGQQDTRMRLRDPVLGHNLVAMAAPLTKWSVQVERADEMGPVLARAFKIAHDAPAGPVFVGLPINVMEEETAAGVVPPGSLARKARPDAEAVGQAAEWLAAAKSPVIVAGDDVARAGATTDLVALAEALGAPVWLEAMRVHVAFPTSHPLARLGLPFDHAQIRKALAGADLVLLIGGPFFEEVWYTPEAPIPDKAKLIQIEGSAARLGYNRNPDLGILADPGEAIRALSAVLARSMKATQRTAAAARLDGAKAFKQRDAEAHKARTQKAWDREPISIPRVMAEIAAGMPKDGILVDESITASLDLARAFDFDGPGRYFGARGGGIGQGIAGAIGIGVASPGRPVVCVTGDGSAMYAIQALWSAAHHDLPILFIVLANREYRILKHNIDVYRVRFDVRTQHPYNHMDLSGPDLGFVEMAKGMGVGGVRVTKAAEIGPAMAKAIASRKPALLEIAIEGKR
jgi:benzoylformate decarboxylase